jgi:manganese/zinc/iron transport system permease protein
MTALLVGLSPLVAAAFWTYNTWMVLLGTMLLGATAGLIGVFLILRRQALMADVVGHATLPGIVITFLVIERLSPGEGKNVQWLTLGALAAGVLAAVTTLFIRRRSRVKSDAAMALVLGVFYGAGAALLTVVQQIPAGSQAGLKDYINGLTAALVLGDVQFFAIAAAITFVLTLLLFKELSLVCFDEEFASTRGLPVFWIDSLLLLLTVSVTVLGLQSVGLILVVATLITPAVSARLWTDRLATMALLACVLGALASMTGSLISAQVRGAAAGPTIVLMGGLLFTLSLLFGVRRGLVWTWRHDRQMRLVEGRHHLIRAAFETIEQRDREQTAPAANDEALLQRTFSIADLAARRAWNDDEVAARVRDGQGIGWIEPAGGGQWRLTADGLREARQVTRNHRLWELYLIRHVELAADMADRTADRIEHVVDADVVRELERQLPQTLAPAALPASPHRLA